MNINPTPYLVSEFVAANTLSMSLIIGNPTNIYLALNANIDFISFFKEMFLLSLIICIIAYFLMIMIFKKILSIKIEKQNVGYAIHNKFYIIIGLIFLSVSTILMAISSYISIPMYLIAFSCAFLLVIIVLFYKIILKKHDHILLKSFKKIPYELLFFLLSMIVIILALNNCNVVFNISTFLFNNESVFLIGLISFLMCSVMNNIPMSILFSNIFNCYSFSSKAIYSCIIASNIGALFTPIGALAGIMFISIIKSFNINSFTFKTFFKYCMPIAIILLSASLLLLLII